MIRDKMPNPDALCQYAKCRSVWESGFTVLQEGKTRKLFLCRYCATAFVSMRENSNGQTAVDKFLLSCHNDEVTVTAPKRDRYGRFI